MVVLNSVPVDLSAARLAEVMGGSPADWQPAADLMEEGLNPSAAFDEVDLREALAGLPWPSDREPRVVAAMGGLGPGFPPAGLEALVADEKRDQVVGLVWSDLFDFLEYRIRQYLLPTGFSPGPRLIPGCPDLSEAAEKIVQGHFAAAFSKADGLSGVSLLQGGALTVVYPVIKGQTKKVSRCDACSRKDCPARLAMGD